MLAKTPEGYAVDYGLLRDTVRQAIHFLDNVIAVSYTHLDVYKRQSVSTPYATLPSGRVMDWTPQMLPSVPRSVSYTHLDVYKRQIQYT